MTNFEVHLEGGVGPLPSEIPSDTSSFKHRATSYLDNAKSRDKLTGRQLVGKSCPSCGSTLVVRINEFDERKFVACDKSRKDYCKFTIGMTETLEARTKRIEHKLNR